MLLRGLFIVVALSSICTGVCKKQVGAYHLLREGSGLGELDALATHASNLPLTRVTLSFFGPDMVYSPGSNTLADTGLTADNTDADKGFAKLKQYVHKLRAAGLEVFLSMGGWDYNCFPYMYARYTIGGYAAKGPNFWKIEKYAGGDLDKCTADNQWCWVCEPPEQKPVVGRDFKMFPEVPHSPSWNAAVAYVTKKAGGEPPVWHPNMTPGKSWTDPKTSISVMVPGSGKFVSEKRNPYEDIVYLAKDLGVDGIDLDYEEMWYADSFKTDSPHAPSPGAGPWLLNQAVYKYAAVARNIQTAIGDIHPGLLMSTAAGAAGAWQGNWWGGNLKGVWYYTNLWFPEVITFMASRPESAGGINVMTYDLSSNEEFHECPQDGVCSLPQQVSFYLQTYLEAGIPAVVGFETGTPAYPDPIHDKDHQLPLNATNLAQILASVSNEKLVAGGFFWEVFKIPASSAESTPTEVAQAICQAFPGGTNCGGVIPPSPTLSDDKTYPNRHP